MAYRDENEPEAEEHLAVPAVDGALETLSLASNPDFLAIVERS